MMASAPLAALVMLLRALKLPTIAQHAEEIAQHAEREGWTFVRYLHHLVELEVHERRRRRIERPRSAPPSAARWSMPCASTWTSAGRRWSPRRRSQPRRRGSG